MSDISREELAKIIFKYTGLGPFPSEQEYAAAEEILKLGNATEERVTMKKQTLRILLHQAILGGAKNRLYAVRKAVRETEAILGLDWVESANSASLSALTEAATAAKAATIIREHWVEKWEHPSYANAVRCMAPECNWEGQFPGDIAEHVAAVLFSAGCIKDES